jgi:hypothetical protein
MATKKRTTKTTVVETGDTGNNRAIFKELRPSALETKYTGSEPLFEFQPSDDARAGQLVRAFNWYSRYYGAKDAKKMFMDYLDANGQDHLAKKMNRVPDSEVLTTYGWLARLANRGLQLTTKEQERLDNEVSRLLKLSVKQVEGVVEEKPVSNRPSIQDIMKERASEAQGELEGFFDDFLLADLKIPSDKRVIKELSDRNVMPQHIHILTAIWNRRIAEFTEALDSKDPQIKEGYGHWNKTQLKNIIKFCEAIIADLNGYASIKKTAKAPRARKAVPVEKVVKNLKFLKKFEDDTLKLKLESISPTKLHGATECWVYNTANRKLTHYVADDYAKSFTVKGNSILGFDKVKSETKTLRKPAMLTEFMKVGKPAKRTLFKDLTTTPTEPNGRFNENIIILQAF